MTVFFLLAVVVGAISQHAAAEELAPQTRSAIEREDWAAVVKTLRSKLDVLDSASEEELFWYGFALIEDLENRTSVEPAQQRAVGNTAIQALQLAWEKQPHSPVTARTIARAGVLCLQIEPIEMVAQAFPFDAEIYAGLAEVHYHLFQAEYLTNWTHDNTGAYRHLMAAERNYREAVTIDSHHAGYRIRHAEVLHRLAQTEEAIQQLRSAVELAPVGYEVYQLMAECHLQIGQFEEAADAYELAAIAAPNFWQGLTMRRATSLWIADKNWEAIELFRELYTIDKGMYEVRLALGKAAFDAEDYALALFAFREAWNIDREVEAQLWTGICAYQLDDDALALQWFEKAETEWENRNPNEGASKPPFWSFVKGRALWELDRKPEALDELETACHAEPENEAYLRWLLYACIEADDPFGVVLAARKVNQSGDPETAWEILQLAREKFSRSAAFRFRDRHGHRHVGGWLGLSGDVLTEVRFQRGFFRTAWRDASLHSLTPMNGWLAVYAGALPRARQLFSQLANSEGDANIQNGNFGLAYVELVRGNVESAQQATGLLDSDGVHRNSIPTLERWASVMLGKPVGLNQFDTYDCLGIHGTWFSGDSEFDRGLEIQGLLPGSPLQSSDPPVVHGDVLLQVGDLIINSQGNLAGVRAADLSGVQAVTVRRNDALFEIEIDFDSVRDRIGESLKEPNTTEAK